MAMKKTAKKAPKKKAPAKKAKAAPAQSKSKAKASSRSKSKVATSAGPKPGALQLASVGPSLTVNDVEKSLAWYRDVLGFAAGERWEHEGKLMGAELRAGSAFFMIGQDDWKKGRDRKKGEGVRLYCETTQKVDAIAKRFKEKGGILDQEPTDQTWGMRDIALTDPDGYKITIAEQKKKR